MNQPETIRGFVSLNLPEPVCDALGRWLFELKSAPGHDALRWAAPGQIHLTLKFFGNVATQVVGEIEAALRKACAGVTAFELTAAGTGAFPNLQRPQVLWVGLAGELDSLRVLRANIHRETNAWGKPAEKDFHPHLTIARVKDAGAREVREIGARLKSLPAPQFGRWQAREIHLMQSELSPGGSRYTSIATIPLGGAA